MDDIESLRAEIDDIDTKIRHLLRKREKKVVEIGKTKSLNQIDIFDKKREEKILEKCKGEYELEIFKKILSESRKIQ